MLGVGAIRNRCSACGRDRRGGIFAVNHGSDSMSGTVLAVRR